jgi:hypothetical protein
MTNDRKVYTDSHFGTHGFIVRVMNDCNEVNADWALRVGSRV